MTMRAWLVLLALAIVVPAWAKPSPKAVASEAYKTAQAYFKEREFAKALASYEVAEAAVPHPSTKYMIAVCRDKLGNLTEAVAAYQRFLDSKPDPKRMADAIRDARARLEMLRKTPR